MSKYVKIAAQTNYNEINEVLDYLSEQIQHLLDTKLIGLYVFGSLTYGDFDPGSSDIDLIAVLEAPLDNDELKFIEDLHLNKFPYAKWHDRVECSYTPIYLFKNIFPPYEPRPYFGGGVFYSQADYGNEWIINNYLLYHFGRPLIGPEFKSFTNPIFIKNIQQACIRDLFKEWEPKINEPDWFNNSHYQSYLILNLCRILYTIFQGKTASKKISSEWTKQNFDIKWSKLISTAQQWKYGSTMSMHKEAIEFLRFVVDVIKNTNIYQEMYDRKKQVKNALLGPSDIDLFLREIIHWGMKNNDILGIALVGSYAKTRARHDSDIDIVILSDNSEKLISNSDWLSDFGNIDNIAQENYGRVTSWHVQYNDHKKIEFGISSSVWAALPPDPGTQKVVLDGMIILYDPKSLLRNLLCFLEKE